MRPERIDALVIGGSDSGDADRILHLLTRSGRLDAFAPSGRKSTRRFLGALEPFTTIEVEIEPRRRGELYTLKSASVARARLGIRSELSRIMLAAYVAELSGKAAPAGDASTPVYEAASQALDLLAEGPGGPALRAAFELRLLGPLGYEPELSRCVVCGAAPGERAFLDLSRGGLLCTEHRDEAAEVGPRTLDWMRSAIGAVQLDPSGGGKDLVWATTAGQKLRPFLDRFWAGLFGRALKSATLLHQL